VDTGRCKPANISTALLVTNIASFLLHNSRNVWNSVINFMLKLCSTWVKKLHKVMGIFSGFIKTVELHSETVETLWAIYTLPTTSGVNNSQQITLQFLFRQENCRKKNEDSPWRQYVNNTGVSNPLGTHILSMVKLRLALGDVVIALGKLVIYYHATFIITSNAIAMTQSWITQHPQTKQKYICCRWLSYTMTIYRQYITHCFTIWHCNNSNLYTSTTSSAMLWMVHTKTH